jgi:hypothetical protein
MSTISGSAASSAKVIPLLARLRFRTPRSRGTIAAPKASVDSGFLAITLTSRLPKDRVGDGDIEALALLVDLSEKIDAAMAEAVKGLRAHGYSWAEIGYRLGITRQAAQQRWGTSKR